MSAPAIVSDHHPILRHVDRQAIAGELQHVLVSLIDLSLLGKQAHWNVVGPNFRPLHLFLDEMVDGWRAAADKVAERSSALGGVPDGMAATVAGSSSLQPLSSAPIGDRDVIAEFTRLLTDAVGDIRTRTELLEDIDTVTADVLHGVVALLEEQLWMVRVQAPGVA